MPTPTISIPTSGVFTRRGQTEPRANAQRRYLLTHLENNDYVLEIDWTSISNYLACPRKALWSLIHARNEPRSAALLYGNAIHHALEAHHRGERDLEKVLARGRLEFQGVDALFLDWRNEDKYTDTIIRYIKKYDETDPILFQPITFDDGSLMVEQAFSLPLTQIRVNQYVPWSYTQLVAPDNRASSHEPTRFWIDNIHVQWTGVIDLGLTSQGQRWVMDHKTSSIGGQTFWDQFTLSQQLRGYIWAAQSITGHTYEGGVVNALFGRKPSAKGQGKDLELERQWIHYRPDQISEWHTSMTSIVVDLVHRVVTDNFPEHSNACVGKYGRCTYLDVCSMPRDARLTMLASDQYADNVWNPLD